MERRYIDAQLPEQKYLYLQTLLQVQEDAEQRYSIQRRDQLRPPFLQQVPTNHYRVQEEFLRRQQFLVQWLYVAYQHLGRQLQ